MTPPTSDWTATNPKLVWVVRNNEAASTDQCLARAPPRRQQRRRGRFQQPMLSIHDRPVPAADRSEAGHWEGI